MNNPLIAGVRQTLENLDSRLCNSIDNLASVKRLEALLKAADALSENAEDAEELLTLADIFRKKIKLGNILDDLSHARALLRQLLLTAQESFLPKEPEAFSLHWEPPKFRFRQRVKRFLEDDLLAEKGTMIFGEVRGFKFSASQNQWIYAVKWNDETEEDFEGEHIYCNEDELMDINLENRVRRHAALLQAIAAGAVTVTLHEIDETLGFPYLEVIAPLPERLNKPREKLIGQSCLSVDPRIGEPRFHAIKKALASGQCETYRYTYDDDFHWEFEVSVAPLYGREEVLTIVRDAASWQLGHWTNKR